MRNTRRSRNSKAKRITQKTLKNIVQSEVKNIQESKKAAKRPLRKAKRSTLNEAKTVENGQRFFRRYLSVLTEAFINNGYSEREAKRRAVAYTQKWMPSAKKATRRTRK